MDLILWRHAEAEPAGLGQRDDERALTTKGRRQAAKMAAWLDRNLPNTCRIVVSPTRRTLQTAQALGRKFKILPGLGPEASAANILELVHWPDAREPVLVVGHQPTLGRVAALIIGGTEQDWIIRKSTALWIAQKDQGEIVHSYLKAVVAPDLFLK